MAGLRAFRPLLLGLAVPAAPLLVVLLGPEVAHSLGIATATATAVASLALLMAMGAAAFLTGLSVRVRRMALISSVASIAWAIVAALAALAGTGLLFIGALALLGALTGPALAYHLLLAEERRAVSPVRLQQLVLNCGRLLPALLILVLMAAGGFTWRGPLLALAAIAFIVGLAGFTIAEPPVPPGPSLGFAEGAAQLLQTSSVRLALGIAGAAGLLALPLELFQFQMLADRWMLDLGARAGILLAVQAAGVLGVLAARHVAGPPRRPGLLLVVVTGTLCGSAFTPLALTIALWLVASACAAAAVTAVFIASDALVPAHLRTHVAALRGILFAAGAVLGLVAMGSLAGQYGPAAAPVVAAIVALVMARRTVAMEQASVTDIAAAAARSEASARAGAHEPMLVCRGVDYAYGQVQVLFGVDFAVDTGEMVALLGTNGAGKSTLLRAIAGVGLCTAGTIRFRGEDVTYLSSQRRVRLGISQVPGGRAVFGALTVVENLLLFGYTLGRGKHEVRRGIDASFAAFPRLAERRNQKAATLSGGEQQMLGLSQALILRPQLLCIDELSLGLAPKVVGELMGMVRRINREGTAVVLVEQSVNIALQLVEHAYFMERGQVRFDGRAGDLLERPDLLRSVFLQGAGTGRS